MTDRDDSLDPIIDILREPAGLSPDLTERVMSEVETLPPHGAVPSRVRWWRRHWTIRLTPVHGLGLAAALAGLIFSGYLAGRPAGPVTLPEGQRTLTQFVLIAPGASSVTVVGDFNDWSMSATPLEKAEGAGVWSVTLPLGPGRYRYAFVVDGVTWRSDPEAPSSEDEFGRANSVLTVEGS